METLKFNFEIEELESIEAPGAAQDFVIGFGTGLGIVAAFVTLC